MKSWRLLPVGLFRLLLAVIFLLIAFAAVGIALQFGLGLTSGQTLGFISLFDLDRESNIPTWYASAQLAGAAVLLFFIARAKRISHDLWARHWFGLGSIFLLLSIEEIARIHERMGDAISRVHKFDGFLTHSWVLIVPVILLVLYFLFWRFFRALPIRYKILFLISAILFVGGAVGMEMVAANIKGLHGSRDQLNYLLTSIVEEASELFGIALFIVSLTDYILRGNVQLDPDTQHTIDTMR